MNSYNLAGLILDSGGEPIKYGILPDEYSAIYEVVDRALELNEMVLISGGSSVGARDMTEKVIEAIEPKGVLFHGVAIKPGKPLIAAFLRGKPVFGLPGHPAAVSVSYLQFIRDILLRIGGCKTLENKEKYRIIQAIISKNVSSAPGREDHIRVSLSTKNGELYAEPILGKSGLIRTLVRADGIIVIASHSQGLPKGETVYVRVFD